MLASLRFSSCTLSALILLASTAFAVPIQWTNTTGGTQYPDYEAGAVAADQAGGVVVTGSVIKDGTLDPQTHERWRNRRIAGSDVGTSRLEW
jgi:hypothetical protein